MENIQSVTPPQAEPDTRTRSKACAAGCGATVLERQIVVEGTHGYQPLVSWEDDWGTPDCPNCRDKKAASSRLELARRQITERLALLEKMLGGPEPLESCTLEKAQDTFSFDKSKAIEAAVKFDPVNENLFFFGPNGSGKSHLAIGIAIDQCRKGASVAYFTPKTLRREFIRVQNDAAAERKLMERLSLVDVFVLDELGVKPETAFSLEALQEVIDGRRKNYRHGMVFTSNLNLDDLGVAFGDRRIPDRLFGACRQLKMDGPSFRRLKR